MFPQLSAGLRVGDIVADRYRIDGVLGAGAMGSVVAAYHLLLAQKVAIKFLHPHNVGNVEATARFIREARAAIRVRNPHITRVLDIAIHEGGPLYIVMEYLDGCDLAEWLRARGPLPVDVAVDYVLQACEGLAEAHHQGIVHRDLKPANLFAVQRDGVVETIKVLDFGISKTPVMVSETMDPANPTPSGAVTDSTTIMGSLFYMSPEQMESSHDVDGRTDIWALGVVLCELLIGRPPFDGNSLPEVYHRIVSRTATSLRTSAPGLPRGIEAIILRCTERQREKRYATIAQLAAALQPYGTVAAGASVERIVRARRASEVGRDGSTRAAGPSTPNSRVSSEKTLASWNPMAASAVAAQPPRAQSRRRGAMRIAFLGAAATTLVVAALVSRRPWSFSHASPSPGAPGPADRAAGIANLAAVAVPTEAPPLLPATTLSAQAPSRPSALTVLGAPDSSVSDGKTDAKPLNGRRPGEDHPPRRAIVATPVAAQVPVGPAVAVPAPSATPSTPELEEARILKGRK